MFSAWPSPLRPLVLLSAPGLWAMLPGDPPPVPKAKAAFTDSSAGPLASTKRVAIANVTVSFQVSVGEQRTEKGSVLNFLSGGRNTKDSVSSVLSIPDLDPKLAQAITDEIYKNLQTDLSASGFEVVPEAELKAHPLYAKILKSAGVTNPSKFANKEGDSLLVAPSSLKLYMPYALELGPWGNAPKGWINNWITAFGNSTTDGGPKVTGLSSSWDLPGLEVELAQALNAHLLKATYVVTLGRTEAKIDHAFTGAMRYSGGGSANRELDKTVDAKGQAFAQVGLHAAQTRLAFRTASGVKKGQVAPRFQDAPPAKDGDVVVALAEPLLGGNDFLNMKAHAQEKRGLFSGGAGNQFTFDITIQDADAYASEVVGLVGVAQKELLSLLKR